MLILVLIALFVWYAVWTNLNSADKLTKIKTLCEESSEHRTGSNKILEIYQLELIHLLKRIGIRDREIQISKSNKIMFFDDPFNNSPVVRKILLLSLTAAIAEYNRLAQSAYNPLYWIEIILHIPSSILGLDQDTDRASSIDLIWLILLLVLLYLWISNSSFLEFLLSLIK